MIWFISLSVRLSVLAYMCVGLWVGVIQDVKCLSVPPCLASFLKNWTQEIDTSFMYLCCYSCQCSNLLLSVSQQDTSQKQALC